MVTKDSKECDNFHNVTHNIIKGQKLHRDQPHSTAPNK